MSSLDELEGKQSLALSLKRLRIGLLLSQEKLAMLAGVPPVTISRLEAGKGTIKTVEKVAHAIGCTINIRMEAETANIKLHLDSQVTNQVEKIIRQGKTVQRLSTRANLKDLKDESNQRLSEKKDFE